MTPEPRPPAQNRALLIVASALCALVVAGSGAWLVTSLRGKIAAAPEEQAEPNSLCPPNTRPEDGSREVEVSGRRVPEWVVFERGNQRVRFRLIVPQTDPPTEPFYVMETKIGYALYASLRYPEPDTPPPLALTGPNDPAGQFPLTSLTGLQARKFAVYAFGGDLPSADEWDHAAGLFDPRRQPDQSLSNGPAWVNRAGPGATKRPTAEADVSRYGLHDLAGNGCEWTRTATDGDEWVLRGRSWSAVGPLTYPLLTEQRRTPTTAPPNVARPDASFRVVLKVP